MSQGTEPRLRAGAGPTGSGRPGRAVAAGVPRHGQPDDEGSAAAGTAPFRAVAVRRVGTARRLRVELLEQPLVAAFGAVPAQLRHPGDLLGIPLVRDPSRACGLVGLLPIVTS